MKRIWITEDEPMVSAYHQAEEPVDPDTAYQQPELSAPAAGREVELALLESVMQDAG